MNSIERGNLIFEWATEGPRRAQWPDHVMIDDETLRDGLQSPSVSDPSLETKVAILHLMESLGIETADVGLPGAGSRQREAVTTLCREIDRKRMRIRPNCAARTMMIDIQPIAEITQTTGVPIEACVFIGSSPIRQYAEEWSLEDILRHTREAIRFAVREGLEVTYVTEDTVRSSPDHLKTLFKVAIEAGAKRLCLCDTCGAAIPDGVFNLVSWVRSLVKELGADVGIDWHGHRDRGLDMGNSLVAIEAGASRVHGTALGIGERVGNTPVEELLVNLKLLGMRDDDLSRLPEYIGLVSESTCVPIPVNTPIVGRDAFRTATGVHAAAVIKAHKKGDNWLADRVYSGVPAAWLARKQEIEIGPMSGNSNVVHFLSTHGLPITSEVVAAVMHAAKHSSQILTLGEVSDIVRSVNPSLVGRRNLNGKRRQKLGRESAGDSDQARL
ncbi:MAG TPA: LeuA family protein [Terriglobales bacterium]|nr:LeuA family protein [Terriglobales bacterium]